MTVETALSSVHDANVQRTKEIERVDSILVITVATARSQGASWADIGTTLGISRQAAWERFHPHIKES